MNKNTELRKTLIDRVKDTVVRDPAAHARLQVSELDKTATRSKMARKLCNDNIEMDLKHISSIDDQISLLKLRYDPLCDHLNHCKEKRRHLQETLESCIGEEHKVLTHEYQFILRV